jgi:hypothetical protein
MTQQMLNPLTKPTKAQSHDSYKDSNQKTLHAKLTQFNLRPNENTLCLRVFVRTNSYFSGEGIDLCWERWICLLLVGGTTSVSSGTDA